MTDIAPVKARIISGILDILIYLFFYLLIILFWASSSTIPSLLNNSILLLIVLLIIYPILFPLISIIFISNFGGTPGKLIAGLEIVDDKGGKISYFRAFFRNYVGYIISGSLFFLGYIWIAIDKERRGWHDMIAGTYVIVRNQTGIIVGIIGIIIISTMNLFLAVEAIGQINSNKQIYIDIITDVKSGIDETFNQPKTKAPFERTGDYPHQTPDNLFDKFEPPDGGTPL